MKILIIEARFYDDISDMLLAGTKQELDNLGVEYEVLSIMGALEIPSIIAMAHDKYDGFIALGCVIRGETTHYDYVCEESARGLMNLSIDYKLPIGNGIITVENREQAIARADKNAKNKGGFVARACYNNVLIKRKFDDK